VLTTVSTDSLEFARTLGADVVIDYKTQRFEDLARDLDMIFDLVDGETRERSWKLLKKGGVLVTTLTDPSQETAARYGVRAMRYTVESDGNELAEILSLVTSGRVKPHVQKTYPLEDAAQALNSVEQGHSVGKIVLTVG
jgi:NADPH:quinone reductase-like Zn-dependent oxidoreductase